jgi:hypothetical protein
MIERAGADHVRRFAVNSSPERSNMEEFPQKYRLSLLCGSNAPDFHDRFLYD